MAATMTTPIDGYGAAGDTMIRRGTGNLGVYATGGVTVTRSTFDFPTALLRLEVDPAGGYVFDVTLAASRASATIKAYRQKDPAAAGGADIPLPEVANAFDLSSVTFRFAATGR